MSIKQATNKLFQLARNISMETKHDVFFNYSPHVHLINVFIHKGGWDEANPKTFDRDIYLHSNWNTPEEIFKQIEDTIKEVKRICDYK